MGIKITKQFITEGYRQFPTPECSDTVRKLLSVTRAELPSLQLILICSKALSLSLKMFQNEQTTQPKS